MIDFEDDLSEMLSEDDHGVEVIYRGRRFSAISNQEFLEPQNGSNDEDRENTIVYAPTCFTEDVNYGEAIQVNKKSLFVIGSQKDDNGLTVLILSDEV